MTKVAHYEVYADSGDGWQLLERFATEQRSQAYQLAKESESASHKASSWKIILIPKPLNM